MKSFLAILWLVVLILGSVAFCSCTETIYDEVLKIDTIFVSKPPQATIIIQTDTVILVDTVEVRVVIRDTVINTVHTVDTLIQVVTKDSIIIREVEKLVTIYDTIYMPSDTVYVTDTVFVDVIKIEQRVIYHDTVYFVGTIRQVTSIPPELYPHVVAFSEQIVKYGKTGARGGNMIIHYVKQADLPGEGWTSNSFNLLDMYSGQIVIQISEDVPAEQARSCIFRELARMQFGKQYTALPDRIMNPLFGISTVITEQHLKDLFQ